MSKYLKIAAILLLAFLVYQLFGLQFYGIVIMIFVLFFIVFFVTAKAPEEDKDEDEEDDAADGSERPFLKLIFLDLDGVMTSAIDQKNRQECGTRTEDSFGPLFDPKAVVNLADIIESTEAQIVITGEWRRSLRYQDFTQMWEQRQLPGNVIDTTPLLNKSVGVEIDRWIRDSHAECSYIILTPIEESEFLSTQQSLVVRTERRDGLTPVQVDQAIGILNAEDTPQHLSQ